MLTSTEGAPPLSLGDLQLPFDAPHLGAPQEYGSDLVLLSSPATDDHEQLLGLIVIQLDTPELRNILTDRTGLGDSGNVQVATQSRTGLRYLRLPSPAEELESFSPDSQDTAGMFEQSLAGETGRGIRSGETREYLAAWRPMAYDPLRDGVSSSWGLLVTMNLSEAYSDIVELRNRQWILQGILAICSLFLSAALARRLTSPVTELASAAQCVTAGQLEVRVQPHSSDELGELAERFNEMTAELARSRAELEERVADRTRALSQANDSLRRSNDDLRNFAHAASHDLKAPLRHIGALVEFLEEDTLEAGGEISEDASRWMSEIVNSVGRMGTLIDDLLALSKVDSDDRPFEPVDLRSVLDHVLAEFKSTMQACGAQVSAQDLPTIQGRSPLLTQLLRNLIGNAIKYRGEAEPRIHVQAERDGEQWELAVIDNGIGIPDDQQARVFELFHRAHASSAYEGTGIGLALCARVVERHGGRIWVEPNPSGGSIFRFNLPAMQRELVESAS